MAHRTNPTLATHVAERTELEATKRTNYADLTISRLRRSYTHIAESLQTASYLGEQYRRPGLEYCRISMEKLHAVECGVPFDEAFDPATRARLAELRAEAFDRDPPQPIEEHITGAKFVPARSFQELAEDARAAKEGA